MARKIIAPESLPQPLDASRGVVFVKNTVNEVIKFEDGTTHQFAKSRTVVDNPELIEKLREAAKKPGNPYKLFEVGEQ